MDPFAVSRYPTLAGVTDPRSQVQNVEYPFARQVGCVVVVKSSKFALDVTQEYVHAVISRIYAALLIETSWCTLWTPP